jgi:hypothetical protein
MAAALLFICFFWLEKVECHLCFVSSPLCWWHVEHVEEHASAKTCLQPILFIGFFLD